MKISTLPLVKYALLSSILLMINLSFSQVTVGGTYGFEASTEGWTLSGSAIHQNNSGPACYGDYALRVNANTSSYVTSPTYDVSSYNQIDISFCHVANNNNDTGDGFTLEYYNGSSWATVNTYSLGTEFTTTGNGNPHSFTFSMTTPTYTFPTDAQFRFRNNTNLSNERHWFDGILIEGYLPVGPEIQISGNATIISDGDITPSVGDDTDFGSEDIAGGTNVNTFTIDNIGTTALSVGAITIAGTNPGDFTVTASPASSVAASGNTSFDITFNPSATGLRTATFSIVNGDSDENPYNFNIQGTGFILAPEIDITGNGSSISDGDTSPSVTDDTDFGSIDVTSGTNVNTFTIENTGTVSLSVGAITIAGAHPGDFTITASPAASVAASGNTSFDITFNPSVLGLRTASVSVVNGDSDENPYNFNIQGTGILPTYSNVVVSVDWPDWSGENRVEVYTPTGTLLTTIDDGYDGSDNTYITSVDLGCLEDLNNYYITMYDIYGDGWNGAANVTVTVGGVVVLTNDGSSTTTAGVGVDVFFDVSGGGPEIEITGNGNIINDGDTTPNVTDDTDFGSVDVTSGTNVNTFTIDNLGCSNLNLTGSGPTYISISGTHLADFTVTANPSTPIASLANTTFDITFNPSANGLRTATISIANDDSDENPYVFDIEGTGFTPAPEINITGNGNTITDGDTTPSVTDDTDFGTINVIAGTNANTFTIENTGTATLSVGTITIGGTHPTDFTLTASPSSSVAASGNTSFEITFDPSANGLRTANISIVNGDSDENPYNFNIQGTGFTPAPEINITGNGNSITDGDTTPSVTDDTDFGNAVVTGVTNTNTFTIENTGTAALSVGTITIGGTNAADFTVTSSPAASVAASGSTTFDITFDPSATGIRTANISIVNGDSDENPYNFNIQGTGDPLPSCTSTETSFPYSEGFESGLGAWIQDAGDDIDWTSNTGGTGSSNTGPSGANEGSDYMYTEATGNANSTAILVSPCFDLTSQTSADFTFYYHMYGLLMGDLYVDISTNNGASWPTNLWSQIGEVQTSSGQAWNQVTIDLDAYVGQTIMLRFRGETSNDYRSDMAIDDIELTTVGTPTPEINITGLGQNIIDGDTTPDVLDDTDFGNVDPSGGTNVNTFTIQNTGTLSLSVGAITISGTHASDFTVTASPASSVSASGSTTFDITFNPSALGLRTASVSIVNGDSDENPYNFDIQGNGAVTTYSFVTVSVDWPSWSSENRVEVYTPSGTLLTTIDNGYTGGSDDIYSTTVNLGCIEDLSNYYITMYDIFGDGWQGAANVTVTAGGATVLTNDGSSTTTAGVGVDVFFNVSGGGGNEIEITGNATVINDGDTTPAVADDTDFGTVDVAAGTNANIFTINNVGCTDLNLTDASPYITIGGANAADFSITTIPSGTITSGNSTTFEITFDPISTGLRVATISIANDDSDENPYNFNIEGTGYTAAPEINVTGNGNTINDGDIFPSTTDDTEFPAVSVTGATHTNTFTIENTGAATLTVGTITIAGLHATDFTVTASPSSSVAPSGSTAFDITFDPSALGLRTANITIANNDSDESTYYFNIQGFGITPGVCGTTIVSYPYTESFESGFGLWTQDINGVNDDFDWTRTNTTTPSSGTGPSAAQDGSYYIYTEATGNLNSTAQLVSPCFDLTGASNPRLTFFYHMHGSVTSGTTTNYMGDLNVEISTDNGLSYGSAVFTQSGYAQTFGNSAFIPVSVDLSTYVGQTIKIRLRGDTLGDARSDMAIDQVTVIDKPTPTVAPGGVTSSLALWLKADEGLSYTTGQSVSAWEDQGLGSDARVMRNGQRPTYYDSTTKNVNFNPVIEFDNSYGSPAVDSDFSHDNVSTEFLSGDFGFYTQEVFIVVIPDDTTINNSFGFMDILCSDADLGAAATDATGLGFGNYTGRVDNEVICYAYDSYDNDPNDGYGVAQTGSATYNNVGIINTRNNTANTQQELYYNANDIEDYQNDIPEYMNANDSRWWIGRSEGWEASLNARVAEVITYSTRKTDTDLTQERNRIQSYLGIKYGITLGVNGTSQDYVNSDGTLIWDQSADLGVYNYDIAGIGRDDASELNQKQSRSVNNTNDDFDGDPETNRTEGVLTIGLTDIYDTNKLNQSDNATTLNNKEYLVWGNNGANLNLASTTVGVNMSSGITPALTTNVTFTAMQRVWKVVENGGDIPTAKVRIPQDAIRNITPPGSFYMFISSTGVFDPTADYRVMTPDGFGNLETDYDFDNTKYITFGYAPQVIVERSVYFDGAVDYVDMEDALDLNSSEFTISAWIKRDAADSGTKSIVSKRNTAFTQGYDFRILDDNRIEIFWKNGSDQTLISTTAIPDDEWHQVSAIYNGSTVRLYIDGIEDSLGSRTAPVDTDESFYIAAAGKGTPVQHFRGNIDEVRVWDRALTPDQLRFIMNQEIIDNATFASGTVLPTSISKNDVSTIPWNNLAGYYPMSVYTYTNTEDSSGNNNQGALRNLNTVDRQTAPLPYESTQNGNWDTQSTWANGNVQTIPGTTSIVNSAITVDWNIIRTNHNVTIDDDSDLPVGKNGNRTILGLMVDSNELEVSGVTDASTNSGYGLTVSHYLTLDGTIDLEGESQLIQTEDSDLIVASSGRLERDQQGTADTYTYNYWSSPVGQTDLETNEFTYNLTNVFQNVTFKSGYDGTASPLQIADYWVWKFANLTDGDYSAWQQTRSTGSILAGEGFTMKGPGSGPLTDDQNYIFRGKPNNGHIDLTISSGNNYLVGNPYPSAIDAVEFINDNLGVTTGTLYFWEHWGGGNHVLSDYQGGYALMNLSGGTPAVTLGVPVAGVSNTGTARKTPGRYIPVSQGFFVDANTGGSIVFENDQRQFQKEDGTLSGDSVFLRTTETGTASVTDYMDTSISGDPRMKFRIGIYTINTIQRQLLLTIDPNATTAVDLGYDGLLTEAQMDDMYWMIDGDKYVIQGSNDAEIDTTYPLGIKTDTEGLNTISINSLKNVPDSMDIFIHDIQNSIYHNLRESDYEIFLPAGEHLDRFEMTFRDSDDTLSIDDNEELSTLDVFYSNEFESLVLLNPNYKNVKSIELFNIVGQSIHTIKDISELDYSEYEVKNLSTGTYIVKINTASGSVSKKVLVK